MWKENSESLLYLIKYLFVIEKQKNCTIQGIFLSPFVLASNVKHLPLINIFDLEM